jgi:soluble lytic murein transglycosylase-like protein
MPGLQKEPCLGAASALADVPSCPKANTSKARRKSLLCHMTLGVASAGWIFFGSAHSVRGAAAAAAPGDTAPVALPLPKIVLNLGTPDSSGPILFRYELPTASFVANVRERLPHYRALFKDAALRSGLDWRLLAAVGYQESMWNPHAVSPTGVRGIMMLAASTADELDIDREDPAECIAGGALYFQQLRDSLPQQIPEPDRTNMALAAYNQGPGHLQDARTLAAQLGGDPNSWKDVRHALPLLNQERWFSKARHGYANGEVAVDYVDSVRGYFKQLDSAEHPPALQVASVEL